jgi:hypothetical protein
MDHHLDLAAAPDDVAVVGLGLLETAEIEVARPGVEPRPEHEEAAFFVAEERVRQAGDSPR